MTADGGSDHRRHITRRAALAGAATLVGTSGCLRLTRTRQEDGTTATDETPSASPTSGDPSSANSTLTASKVWELRDGISSSSRIQRSSDGLYTTRNDPVGMTHFSTDGTVRQRTGTYSAGEFRPAAFRIQDSLFALVKHVVDFQSAASRACLSASSPGFL